MPRSAIAELALALHQGGESRLAHKLGSAIDAHAAELVLGSDESDRVFRVLSSTPIPGLEELARELEEQLRGPESDRVAAELALARRKRLAANEAFFRDVNERLEQESSESALSVVLCECADEDCTQRLTLSRREYEAVRADPAQFVVAVGHCNPEIEEVVTSTDRFQVVRKLGVGRDVVERLEGGDTSLRS